MDRSKIIFGNVISDRDYRKAVRALTFAHGSLTSTAAKKESSVYDQYYDFSEKLNTLPGHRVLAINRGEKEEYLKVGVTVPEEVVLDTLFSRVVKPGESPAKEYVVAAVKDSYERLIAPSVEREVRNDLFDRASAGAIVLFAENLQHLLMQAPIKGKTVLVIAHRLRTIAGANKIVTIKDGKAEVKA